MIDSYRWEGIVFRREKFFNLKSESHGTEDSNLNSMNIFSILELVIAVKCFWIASFYREDLKIIYAAIVVSPLLLMKSRKSISDGVGMMQEGALCHFPGLGRFFEPSVKAKYIYVIAVLVGVVSGVASYLIIFPLLPRGIDGMYGPLRLLLWAAIAIISVNIPLAMAVGLGGFLFGSSVDIVLQKKFRIDMMICGSIGMLTLVVGLGMVGTIGIDNIDNDLNDSLARSMRLAREYGLFYQNVTLYAIGNGWDNWGVLIGSLPAFFLFNQNSIGNKYEDSPINVLRMLPGVLLGIFINALIVRVLSILLNIKIGIYCIPENIYLNTFCESPFNVPEILPGLPADHPLRARAMLLMEQFPSGRGIFYSAILRIGVILWFVPGVIYRFLLKSTFWIWWIFLVLGLPSGKSATVRYIEKNYVKKYWRWAYAAVVFMLYVISNIDILLKDSLMNAFSGEKVMPILIIFMNFRVTDFYLYQSISVISGFLSIFLPFFGQSLSVDGSDGQSVDRKIKIFVYAERVKSVLSLSIMVLTILYIATLMLDRVYSVSLSPFACQLGRTIYGVYSSGVGCKF